MTKEEAKLVLENARPQTKEIDRQFYDDEDLNNAIDMAINALEQQSIAEERYQDLIEYFGDENVAKCVLEDREEFKKWLERIKWHVQKADELARKLEQPSDCVSVEVYKQVSWERDIAIEQLRELGYSFGEKIRTSEDCVSRQAVIEIIKKSDACLYEKSDNDGLIEEIKTLSPVTPTHGTCKDCEHSYTDADGLIYCCNMYELARFYPKEDFYCADFEKRGSENDI